MINNKIRVVLSLLYEEYAMILALLSIPVLFIFKHALFLPALLFINVLILYVVLMSSFGVIRHANILAKRQSNPYGVLILSLSVVLLGVSLISALMIMGKATPMLVRDTLYGLIMLVLGGFVGMLLLLGGGKFKTQYVNLAGITQYLTAIIPLAILVLVLPITLDENTFSHGQLLIVASLSAFIYIIFTIIQTITHPHMFVFDTNTHDVETKKVKASLYSNWWHGCCLGTYFILIISVMTLNESFLTALLVRLDVPIATTGFIVALLVFAPIGLNALRFVLRNELQQAMNMCFGAVLAIISLAIPIVILIALVTGQEIVLGLSYSNIVILFGIFLLCQASFASGRTNQLDGAAHLVIFIAYFIVLLQ